MLDSSVRMVAARLFALARMTRYSRTQKQGISFFGMDAGVSVTATRYDGMIHDFVLLNAIRELPETKTALRQASDGIRDALKP